MKQLQEVCQRERTTEASKEAEEKNVEDLLEEGTAKEILLKEKESKVEEDVFVPNWGIKSKENVIELVGCEDYLVHSVPKGVEASFMKMKRLDFENSWIQKKCESWFHD